MRRISTCQLARRPDFSIGRSGSTEKYTAVICGLLLSLAFLAAPAPAQDGSNLGTVARTIDESKEEINNGTNPTLLTTQAGIQFQHTDIGSGLDAGLFEAFYTQPILGGNKAFRVTVPVANSPIDSSFELGDISLTYIDVFHLTEKNGAAFTAELFLDTATRIDNGFDQFAMETSVFYAWFLDNGAIFAPAWVQDLRT